MHVPSPHLNSLLEQLADLTPKQPTSSDPSFFKEKKIELNSVNRRKKRTEGFQISKFKQSQIHTWQSLSPSHRKRFRIHRLPGAAP